MRSRIPTYHRSGPGLGLIRLVQAISRTGLSMKYWLWVGSISRLAARASAPGVPAGPAGPVGPSGPGTPMGPSGPSGPTRSSNSKRAWPRILPSSRITCRTKSMVSLIDRARVLISLSSLAGPGTPVGLASTKDWVRSILAGTGSGRTAGTDGPFGRLWVLCRFVEPTQPTNAASRPQTF